MSSINIFGAAPAGLVAFSEPEMGGDDFVIIDHVGEVGIFTVIGPEQVTTNKYGVKPAIKANVTICGQAGDTNVYTNVLIFSAVVVKQLSESAGQQVVAGIESFTSKYGTEAPKLAAPTAEQLALANAVAA